MSRGPGAVARAVTAHLDTLPQGPLEGWVPVRQVAEAITEGPLTRARLESVRRACKSLAAAGGAELDYFDHHLPVSATRVQRGEWVSHRIRHRADRKVLCVHRPLSVEARNARARHYRDSLERIMQVAAEWNARP